MHGGVIPCPGDVRFEYRDDPTISAPTDTIIRILATCVPGSDPCSFRGTDSVRPAHPDGARILRKGRRRG